MAGIAIIANPNARRNREWPLAAQQLRKAAPGAAILETRSPEELLGVARVIQRDRPRVLAIAGGDGTVTHTVTALANALGGDLPPLALLGGGAYDSLAPLGGSGAAEDRLRRLAEALASGSELRVEQRDTLRIIAPDGGGDRCGFRFGVGLPVRFVEAIYATGVNGPWTSTRVLARAFWSSLTRGAFAKSLYAPMDLRVRLDAEEWPAVEIYGLVCATVAEAGLGLRPFRRATEQPGAFQVLGLTAGPRQFALELPRLLVGLPARRDRLLEGVGEKLELSGRAPLAWFLDGEIYTSKTGKLVIGLGPRVSLVRA
ncbi:MAG TPA: diacylglycerol kinase family protein [Myxococcales bacterium]|jgi:diacylglycerol kinase family enzyme|nr:diacylglycerol kinase family protein [Myxococcales bacterium]